ncbi:unnamed protein product [Arabis nemorensis]|uniref:Secreted protein n=1 Tax=Arabis nemorensis TaxID=586526 RepID=A0A565AUM4_9BRAS|nr:unnamed protein product [Arabis nemorensis]
MNLRMFRLPGSFVVVLLSRLVGSSPCYWFEERRGSWLLYELWMCWALDASEYEFLECKGG